MTDPGRTALYRMYDVRDTLLYIGIASEIGKRWDQHVKRMPWWDSVHHQTVTWHDTRDEAEGLEKDAIRDEQPRYNVIWNGPGRRRTQPGRPYYRSVRASQAAERKPAPKAGRPMIYLESRHVISLNADLTGSGVVRDAGLVESACHRPQATAFGEDAYPTVWDKAAALFQSLACNHALLDGNKRTAWVSAMAFLTLNGHPLRPGFDEDAAVDFVLGVATGTLAEIADIASELATFTTN